MKRPLLAFALGASFALAGGCDGCKSCNQDKAPDPLPDASVEPDASAHSIQPPVDDAGDTGDASDASDAADADARATGGGPSLGNLRACCAALQANAASAPPPQNTWVFAAAQYCNASVAAISNPAQKDAFLANIRMYLRTAPMPTQCK